MILATRYATLLVPLAARRSTTLRAEHPTANRSAGSRRHHKLTPPSPLVQGAGLAAIEASRGDPTASRSLDGQEGELKFPPQRQRQRTKSKSTTLIAPQSLVDAIKRATDCVAGRSRRFAMATRSGVHPGLRALSAQCGDEFVPSAPPGGLEAPRVTIDARLRQGGHLRHRDGTSADPPQHMERMNHTRSSAHRPLRSEIAGAASAVPVGISSRSGP